MKFDEDVLAWGEWLVLKHSSYKDEGLTGFEDIVTDLGQHNYSF